MNVIPSKTGIATNTRLNKYVSIEPSSSVAGCSR
jgi:hypothetical protein